MAEMQVPSESQVFGRWGQPVPAQEFGRTWPQVTPQDFGRWGQPVPAQQFGRGWPSVDKASGSPRLPFAPTTGRFPVH
jgi:hypothetical protein